MSEPFDQLEPDAVARSDRFIDALAKREPVDGDSGDRALAGLFEDWRDELRTRPTAGVCEEHDAIAALARGLAEGRRARRRTAVVGAMAAVVLSVAGFGVLMGRAQPDDPFYGARTTLFGEPASVHDERMAVSAETELNRVERLIALGQWDQAHDELTAVSAHVQTVKDADRKQVLIDHMNRLNAKVVSRNPHATVLPSDPGITVAPNGFDG